jgi:hypothetical protein
MARGRKDDVISSLATQPPPRPVGAMGVSEVFLLGQVPSFERGFILWFSALAEPSQIGRQAISREGQVDGSRG